MKVSVLMITYNHEQFITEAIESALAQRTSFDYELVIGEDCSTDNTGRIVDDYARRNPQRIRVIRSDCNIGIRRNFDRVLQACEGEYVAMLEGDDRFICRDKLQIQAEFLDAHADHSMVFHRIRTFDELDKQRGWTGDDCTSMTENWIENLILWNYISTVTVMFRRELTKGFNVDVWPEELLYTDYGLWLWLALKGRFGFVPDIMAEYRLHAGGVCSSQTREADERNWLSVYPHAESWWDHNIATSFAGNGIPDSTSLRSIRATSTGRKLPVRMRATCFSFVRFIGIRCNGSR